MAVKKVKTKYYDKLWAMLTQGATQQLEGRKEGDNKELIKNFSPNNVRRLILGLDGMFVQFYTSEGTGVTRKQRLQKIELDEELVAQLCHPDYADAVYTPLDMLHKDRVFSSIEEIIILGNDKTATYTFVNSGLDWFTRDVTRVARSFKRLRCVTYLDTNESIEEFISSVQDVLDDPLTVVTSVLEDTGKYVTVVNGEDYLLKTSLRPQHYEADAAGGTLANYFERVKVLYYEDYKRRLLAHEVVEEDELQLDVFQAVFDKFKQVVLPRYDKVGVLDACIEDMAKVVADAGVEVDSSRLMVYRGTDLKREHKQYGVMLDTLFAGGLPEKEVALVSVRVLLEQLDACSKLVRKYKLTGVMPKIKSLGIIGLVSQGDVENKLSEVIQSVGADFNKYIDIYERVGALEVGVEGDDDTEEVSIDSLDRGMLNQLGKEVANYFGYDFTELSKEELEKLAKVKKEEPKWLDSVANLKNLVGTDLRSKAVLGSSVVKNDLDKLGVVGILGYSLRYGVTDLEDLINVVVVKRVNEGTDLALDDDVTLADLAMKLADKRSKYKQELKGYTEIRDKLSQDRLLTYIEDKIDTLDNMGILLMHDKYVIDKLFDWLAESDAAIPLLFAFKNTGEVIYTKNEKLTKDKLLKEVFHDGEEPLEDSLAKLKDLARLKTPKKQLSDKSKSLNDMFRTAVRKVDGIDE
jgi:hypothetical protein